MKTNLYYIGDIVEFKDGGFGIVSHLSEGFIGQYSCLPVDGLPDHPICKRAWFSNSEINKLIGESPLRCIKTESVLNQSNLPSVKTKTESQIR